MRIILILFFLILFIPAVIAIDCSNPDYLLCDDFEGSPPYPTRMPEFSIYERQGVLCNNVGYESDCGFSKIIEENDGIPKYTPEIYFPVQDKTVFIHFRVKHPENFFIQAGTHGYFFKYINSSGGAPYGTTLAIDPLVPEIREFEWDIYNVMQTQQAGYARMGGSYEGFEPGDRGEWHSYQVMIVPSDQDASVGRTKIWVDGKLNQFAQAPTAPLLNAFQHSNYWHSLYYITRDTLSNLFERYTAINHPAFEVQLDDFVVSNKFIEEGLFDFQIERVRFTELAQTSFEARFDTTQLATATVEWGETESFELGSYDTTQDFFHVAPVTGLEAGKNYYLRIQATDENNRDVYSQTYQFNTNGAYPDFVNLPGWKGEVYEGEDGQNPYTSGIITGTPSYVKNFNSLSHVAWPGVTHGDPSMDDYIDTAKPLAIRYSRTIEFDEADYTFQTAVYDGGMRLFVDSELEVNNPEYDDDAAYRRDFTKSMTAGTHNITVEQYVYRPGPGDDFDSLSQRTRKYIGLIIKKGIDTTPPKVVGYGVFTSRYQNPNTATFVVNCNEACKIQVDYGPTTSYGTTIPVGSLDQIGMTEDKTATGLTIGQEYHYKLTVYDAYGNSRELPDSTFVAGDTIPPLKPVIKMLRSDENTLRFEVYEVPGEDSRYGSRVTYDLRYSNQPMTIYNWDSATSVPGFDIDADPGSRYGQAIVTGFPEGQPYYFALKSMDQQGQWSLMSNVVADGVDLGEVYDSDGDGYGIGMPSGYDCDDQDASIHQTDPNMDFGFCIANQDPAVYNVECFDGASWVDCQTLNVYDVSTIEQVRTTCTSENENIATASFVLRNQNHNITLFSGDYTSSNGDVYTFNNPDTVLDRSGTYTLRATCIDTKGESNTRTVSWSIPWGTLTVQHNTPLDGTIIDNGQTTSFQTTSQCQGGDCGEGTATLKRVIPESVLGNDHIGTSMYGLDYNYRRCSVYTLPEDAVVKSITRYGRVNVEFGQAAVAIYNASPASPENYELVVSSELYVEPYTSPQWNVFPIEETLLPAGDYALCVGCFSTHAAGCAYWRDSGGTGIGNADPYPFEHLFGESTWNSASSVSIYANYSKVSDNEGKIPVGAGNPFYVLESNPQSCTDMQAGDTCTASWTVTANGDYGDYEFFADYDMNRTTVADTASPSITITIGNGTAPCTMPYDEPTCGCIDSADLAESIAGWFSGVIDISELLANIKSWKSCG